jgi:hypothetical protein
LPTKSAGFSMSTWGRMSHLLGRLNPKRIAPLPPAALARRSELNTRRQMTETQLRECRAGMSAQDALRLLQKWFPSEPWSVRDAATTEALDLLNPDRLDELKAVLRVRLTS